MYFKIVNSPLGPITLQANADGLTGLWLSINRTQPQALGEFSANQPYLKRAESELMAYFDDPSRSFCVPIAPSGTEFQKRVWACLREIPSGQTSHYQCIAQSIGRPKAVRAVGAAIGRNPISIIVPCHRVLGKNGQLTGYAGGLANKQWLLHHEKAHKAPK